MDMNLVEEDSEHPQCDFVDHDHPATDYMLVAGVPVAAVCEEAMELIRTKTSEHTHKIALDTHYHRHTVVELVDATDPAVMGQDYSNLSQAVN